MKIRLLLRGVAMATVGLAAAVHADTPPVPLPTPSLPQALGCPNSTNCVNSLGVGDLSPLAYTGSAADGMARLRATLSTFSDAKVERADEVSLTAIFTTRLGFRDEVVFLIDPSTQRIHFRSRSLVGYYDFGKNRSRMQEVGERFAITSQP
ncbi:MAG: DUF1499 domain-containing protein [Hydrogenophaga sp.]|nr:DUF1499 domain-containing protein [Hydrogenophaga sp.]